ncbi:hypothetical protein DL93DRAFT_1857304 [Clavulina sp. PMI_390]|nr:hypothetical protein DL93DRAFT_1857304 [Clavulina sp. PMI_390]
MPANLDSNAGGPHKTGLSLGSLPVEDGQSSSTLVEDVDTGLDSSPFESLASEMLQMISDLQEILHVEEQRMLTEQAHDIGADNAALSSKDLPTPPSPHWKGFSLFKDFFSTITSTPPSATASDSSPTFPVQGWKSLLDSCVDGVNRVIAAQVVIEKAENADRDRPPLFWLLYSGHRCLQDLLKVAAVSGAPTPSLEGWDPQPLLRWSDDAQKLFRKHGLADDQRASPTELSEIPDQSSLETPRGLLELVPQGMVQLNKNGLPFCMMGEFNLWITHNRPTIHDESFGRLRELSLFRGANGPFRHEFLVAGFGDDGQDPSTWLRLERRAQLPNGKTSSLAKANSSTSLFGGVKCIETISFSTTKSSLCAHANELARITLEDAGPSPILISTLCLQMQSTSNSNPEYQLFITNCRWFSRRGLLNAVHSCETAHIPLSLTWKGAESSVEVLRAKLEKPPLWRSEIQDLRDKGASHRALLAFALDKSTRESTPLSRAVLDPFLDSLKNATLDPDERTVLIADLLTKRSHVVAQDDLPQALEDAERAVKLMRDLPKDAFRRNEQLVWSLGALGSALRMAGRFDEAISALRECSELDTDKSQPFALRLAELGVVYTMAGQPAEAVKAFEKSVDVLRRIDGDRRWADTRGERANILTLLAKTLDSLNRHDEAITVRQEVVSICRDLGDRGRDGDHLVTALINLANCAYSAKKYELSQEALKEANRLCRSDPKIETMLPMVLALSARTSYRLRDLKSALRYVSAAIDLKSSDEDGDPVSLRGVWLVSRSMYFFEAENMLRGLEDVEAAIPIYKSAHDRNPQNTTIVDQLWNLHFTRANALRKLGRAEAALVAFRNAAAVQRPAVEAESEGPEQLFLELIFTLDGCVMVLKELRRPEEARVYAEESINLLRLRQESSVSSVRISETLHAALLRHSRFLAEIGDGSEALALTTQAANISQPSGVDQYHVSALLRKMLQEIEKGRPGQAIATAQTALELCEIRLPDRRDLRSLTLSSYARALDEAGKHAEAAEKQQQSLAIFRELADFTTTESRISLAQRLGKLSEYYQDGGLFEQALVSIDEAVEWYQALYEDGDDDGQAYSQIVARRASILFSLDLPEEANAALEDEFNILKTALRDMPPDNMLDLTQRCHRHMLSCTQNGKVVDALDAARQYVVLMRLASALDSEVDGSLDGENGPRLKGSLEDVLITGLLPVTSVNVQAVDGLTATLESLKLSPDFVG